MKEKIEILYKQIADRLLRTPLVKNKGLSSLSGCEVYLKFEHQQLTGSFKLRGALSKMLVLSQQSAELKEVVAASTGNHAAAVCHAALPYHCRPTIFVPQSVSAYKLARLRQTQALIKIEGRHSGESEILAEKWARNYGLPLVHPYNDEEVIAGQGTIGLELWQQLPQLDAVFVPVGGGGLISGIASYLKTANPSISIVGVQPENACEMAESLELGYVVDPSEKSTISDGTAGGLDPNSITLEYCRDLVDDFILVSEKDIINSLQLMFQHASLKVEPAAALALAAILKRKEDFKGKKCAAVVCGGNIKPEDFEKLMSMS